MKKQHLKSFFEKNASGKNRNKQVTVRFCLPFSIMCLSCKIVSAKYTRFNCSKETFKDTTCSSLEKHRFILKCKNCREFFTILTDSDNGVYVVEEGCINVESHCTEIKIKKNELDEEIIRNKSLQDLEINIRKLLSIDIDLVIESLKTNETIESLNRKKLLEKLEKLENKKI